MFSWILENKSFCTVVLSPEGKLERIYTGNVNVSETGKPCKKWSEISQNSTTTHHNVIGDHNYCRNPGREEDREFCYVSEEARELCVVRTCGKIFTNHHSDHILRSTVDSAEVLVYMFESLTGEERVVQLTPVRTTTRLFGKCATYDLDSEKNHLSRIRITSSMDIYVLLHDRNQLNIHRELSLFYQLKGLIKFYILKSYVQIVLLDMDTDIPTTHHHLNKSCFKDHNYLY